MNIFRRLTIIGVAKFSLLFLCACAQGTISLVQNGKCLHHIVLNPGAGPSERHAAGELQSHSSRNSLAENQVGNR